MSAPTPLRVAIIDDEPLARESLRIRLSWIPDVEVVAEAATGGEALDRLGGEILDAIDAVFLDVEMPEIDGVTVARSLGRNLLPAIIFVTAHGEYALDAFAVGAFDYLLKPFDDEMLRRTVERVRTYAAIVRSAAAPDRRDEPAGTAPAAATGGKLRFRSGDQFVFLDPDDVEWVEAQGDYVRVHCGPTSYTIRDTMRRMEAWLGSRGFVRVHRAAIVAIRLIRQLQPYSRGEHLVVLKDGTRLPLSRRYRRRVEAALTA